MVSSTGARVCAPYRSERLSTKRSVSGFVSVWLTNTNSSIESFSSPINSTSCR